MTLDLWCVNQLIRVGGFLHFFIHKGLMAAGVLPEKAIMTGKHYKKCIASGGFQTE
jgi:hypothetical protein